MWCSSPSAHSRWSASSWASPESGMSNSPDVAPRTPKPGFRGSLRVPVAIAAAGFSRLERDAGHRRPDSASHAPRYRPWALISGSEAGSGVIRATSASQPGDEPCRLRAPRPGGSSVRRYSRETASCGVRARVSRTTSERFASELGSARPLQAALSGSIAL